MRRALPGITAITIPLAFVIYWHTHNFIYPYGDEAVYFTHSHRVYFAFRDHGILEALKAAYLYRHDKAVIHPWFAIPALIAVDGNVLLSLKITLSSLFATFIGYVFAWFRLHLSPWRAVLGTLTLGLTAGVLNNSYTLNSEFPMMLSIVATLFHLERGIRPEINQRHLIAAGVWWAIGICVRPIEILILSIIPFAWTLYVGIQSKLARGRDLAILFAGLLVFALCSSQLILQHVGEGYPDPPELPYFAGPLGLAFFPGLIPLFFWKRLELSAVFTRPLLVAYLIVTICMLPFVPTIYNWAYVASFGEFTIETGNRIGVSYLEFMGLVARNIFGFPFVALMSLACLRGVFKPSPVFVLVILSAILHPLLGGITYNGDIRYYAGSGTLFYLLALVWALRENGKLPRLRATGVAAIVSLLVLTQGFLLYTAYYVYPPRAKALTLEYATALRALTTKWNANTPLPLKHMDPRRYFLEELQRYYPGRQRRTALVRTPVEDERMNYIFEQPPVLTIQQELGQNWEFHHTSSSVLQSQLKQLPKLDAIIEMVPISKIHPPLALRPDLDAANLITGYKLAGWFIAYDNTFQWDGPAAFALVYAKTSVTSPADVRRRLRR